MEKQTQFNIWYFILAVLAVLWLHDLWVQARQVEPIPYSEFQTLLKERRVKQISVHQNYIHGELTAPLADGRSKFVTTRVETDLAKDLAQYGVTFTGVVESTFLRDMLGWVVPAWCSSRSGSSSCASSPKSRAWAGASWPSARARPRPPPCRSGHPHRSESRPGPSG